jgi:hypothetical protein
MKKVNLIVALAVMTIAVQAVALDVSALKQKGKKVITNVKKLAILPKVIIGAAAILVATYVGRNHAAIVLKFQSLKKKGPDTAPQEENNNDNESESSDADSSSDIYEQADGEEAEFQEIRVTSKNEPESSNADGYNGDEDCEVDPQEGNNNDNEPESSNEDGNNGDEASEVDFQEGNNNDNEPESSNEDGNNGDEASEVDFQEGNNNDNESDHNANEQEAVEENSKVEFKESQSRAGTVSSTTVTSHNLQPNNDNLSEVKQPDVQVDIEPNNDNAQEQDLKNNNQKEAEEAGTVSSTTVTSHNPQPNNDNLPEVKQP